MSKLFHQHLCHLMCVTALFFTGMAPAIAETDIKSNANPAITRAVELVAMASLNLTVEEKAWLAEHKTIRVAFDGYFPPYSFLNKDGQFEGLAVDTLQILTQRIGVTLEISPKVIWTDLYEAAKRREVDIVATMGSQPAREEWFAFTRPYIFKSLVIMTKEKTTGINKPEDLAGKTVALVQSYQYVKPLLEQYPSIKPYYVDTMLDGLNGVATGRADAAITFVGAGYYLKTKYQIANLKFAAVFERDRFTESIAVRKDWPELATILDKALASITDQEMTELNSRWIGQEEILGVTPHTFFIYLGSFFGLGLLLIAGFTIWNRALQRQVNQRTAELRQELAERKKTEEALQESEERFRDLVENTTDWVWEVDTKGVYTYASPAVRFLLGYEPVEMIGKRPFDFMPSDEAQRVSAIFSSLASQQKPVILLENITLHKDGHPVIWETRGGAFFDLDGAFCGYRGIAHDVTERKKVHEKLRLSEDKFAKAFHNSPDAIALTSLPDGHFVEVNERFLELSGYHLDEIIGRNTIDLDLWVNQSRQQQYLDVLGTQHRVNNLEADFHKKSGEIIPCTISGEVIESQSGKFILNVIRDISESKKAATELQSVNEELRAVNRIIMTCASTMDAQEILDKIMDEALLITGLEGGTICSVTSEQTLEIIAHRQTSQATIADLTNHAIQVGDCLCGECARDHKPLILHDRAAVLKFSTREATRGEDIRFHAAFPLVSGKRCIGVLCIFTRTDAKPSEQSLKLLETVASQIAMAIDNAQLYAKSVHQAFTLEEQVRERTSELDEARQALLNLVEDLNSSNARLKELDQLKSMFIASMSHELRTPLNSVIGFSSILLQKWQGPLNEEQEKNLAIILRAGKHLLSLINDVIDISKIEAGALPIELEPFELNELLAEAVESVLPDAKDKGLTIELRSCAADMHTDRRRLLQCVLNLLSNAVKFSHQGAIIITAQCNGDAVITVTDPGIGISSKDLPTLFQAFVRLSPPGQATYPGTGLGLYLTRKLTTEILGGTVGATSEEGRGSSFTITIPKQISGQEEPRE